MRTGPGEGNARGRRGPRPGGPSLLASVSLRRGCSQNAATLGRALPAADAVPAGPTAGADSILRSRREASSLAGMWAARPHAHRPRPPLAFGVHILLFVNIWHQWTPLRRNIWKLTHAREG